jgi:hypothetical protein
MSDDGTSYYTATSDGYWTTEEEDDWMYEFGFMLCVSTDGTPWYLSSDVTLPCQLR